MALYVMEMILMIFVEYSKGCGYHFVIAIGVIACSAEYDIWLLVCV